MPWEYKAKVIRVVDGSTVDCMVDLGFKTWLRLVVHLSGVLVPELDDSDHDQRILARRAKEHLEKRLLSEPRPTIYLRTRKSHEGSTNAWGAELLYGTPDVVESLNRELIQEGLALRRGS